MREGKRRLFSVEDGAGNSVAKVDFVIADDPAPASPRWRRQQRPRECRLARFLLEPNTSTPVGTHRRGPIVNWQWRTDVLPRLQHVESNTVTFDSRSEEGEILIRWGFKPQLLGYIPNVRGAVTGVP